MMLQPRRRRLPLNTIDNDDKSLQESREEKSRNGKVKKRRKRRRRQAHDSIALRRRIVLCIVLSTVLATSIWKIRQSQSINSIKRHLRSSLWASRNPLFQLEHRNLYDTVHRSANHTQEVVSSYYYEKRSFTISSTYGTNVTEQGCNLTVVFMDPRLATAGAGGAAWFSLESVAAFCPDACILLQTASCVVREQLEEAQGFVSDEAVNDAVANHVYDAALPLFRDMIEQGRVRITFPDHEKYHLKSCSDYGNPSSALMNINYWTDEFIEGVDSDYVLFIQDDAVICHEFDLDRYKDYAFVGAVWSKTSFQLKEGMCHGMPLLWSTWIAPQKRWERQQMRLESIPADKRLRKPDLLLNTSFPDVCNNGLGPIGNGGLSLRSRSWAVKAIETCPHVKISAVDVDETVHACKVLEDINEDLYFGIVLRGIGAPLPSAYEASLFSTEMLWPEQVQEMFGSSTASEVESVDQERHLVDHDGQSFTVPAAVHKPWWYHSSELLRSREMDGACPFLQYVFPSEQSDPSKWKEWQKLRADTENQQRWQGIGA